MTDWITQQISDRDKKQEAHTKYYHKFASSNSMVKIFTENTEKVNQEIHL